MGIPPEDASREIRMPTASRRRYQHAVCFARKALRRLNTTTLSYVYQPLPGL